MFDFDLSFSQGECVLLTSQLAAPGDFVLHRALAAQLKGRMNQEARCVVVSIAGDLARWKAVAAKSVRTITSYLNSPLMIMQNLDLGKLSESGRFVYLDPLPLLPEIENAITLSPVYEILTPLLTANTLLLITDLAPLEWIGVPTLALTRFVRAIRSFASKVCVHMLLNRTIASDRHGRAGGKHADIPSPPSASRGRDTI